MKNKTFTTLSDWTESCIQDILKEYSTRYSSWKRVTHAKSAKTLDELWKLHREKRLKKVKKPTVSQLRQLNERLLERLAKANEKIQDLSEESVKETVHPIMMDSPHGTFLVLQRMTDTGNPALDSVQNMGLEQFRKHLKEFSSTKKVVESGEWSEEWFDKLRKQKTSDHDIAKFVYNFFMNGKRKAETSGGENKKRLKIVHPQQLLPYR